MVDNKDKISVLFVCMGNICRSPSAQGVMEALVAEQELAFDVIADSAGTHAYHCGEPPDRRSQAAAERRGVDISGQRARQVTISDFEKFDLILAMDTDNLLSLRKICPAGRQKRIRLLMEFAPDDHPLSRGNKEVPDPYYGGNDGFKQVVSMVEIACQGVLDFLGANENDRI